MRPGRRPVPGRRRDVQAHPADGVDHLAEAVEADLGVVVDGDPEVRLDGVDDALRPVLEGLVDEDLALVFRQPHEGVAGDGDENRPAGLRLDPGDDDHVGPLAADGAGVAEAALVLGVFDEGPGVGPEQEDVHRAGEGPVEIDPDRPGLGVTNTQGEE